MGKAVTQGKFAAAYYFYGDDDFRMNEAIRYIREKFLPFALQQSNSSRIDLNSQKFGDVRDALMALPFFGESSLVTIVNPQKLSPKQLTETQALLKVPAESRVVIFYTRAAKKPDRRSSLPKKLEIVATVVEFPKLTPIEAQNRATRAMQACEIEIEPLAARELAEMTSCDSGRLTGEIDKLIAFAAEEKKVSLQMVRQVASETTNRSVYQLVDYVLAGNTSGALEAFEPVLEGGDTPTGILYWLGASFLDIYLVKGGRKLPPYKERFRGKLERQANRLSLAQIESALSSITATEAALKGGIANGPTEGKAALHELILTLCAPQAQPRQQAQALNYR